MSVEDLDTTKHDNADLDEPIEIAAQKVAIVPHPAFSRPLPTAHTPNGDETDHPTFIGNFHKGLRHINEFGEVDPVVYQDLQQALANQLGGSQFEDAITLHSDVPPFGRKLINPQAGFSGDTEVNNPDQYFIPAAPKVDSAEAAAEAIELYWMALLRDVPFVEFGNNQGVANACTELTGLGSAFSGPRDNAGNVTPGTVFRGSAWGDLVGPYVSQFLLKDISYGTLSISQRQKTTAPSIDYLIYPEDWLAVQNGRAQGLLDQFDSERRHIRSMRDLGQYVHIDQLYEAYLNACLILLQIGAPVDNGNPYKTSAKQAGFGTFGGTHILTLVCEVATRALKAVWYQKWVVHRRLRPEAYGGLVHWTSTNQKTYPIHASVLNSNAVQQMATKNGTFFMPMAFPEGSPTHPAYGAGHATVAGACVTILKAFFDESHELPDPVQTSADGKSLKPYTGGALTVGNELNKVAANIAIGRNMAGVHWRTDYTESLRLGEQIAIDVLTNQSALMHEAHSFSFTKFDGKKHDIVHP